MIGRYHGAVMAYAYDGEGPWCPDCYAELVEQGRKPPTDDAETITVLFGAESDTPEHCLACEALLPFDLTPDGIDYVREAVEGLEQGQGRREIIEQWQGEYLPGK